MTLVRLLTSPVDDKDQSLRDLAKRMHQSIVKTKQEHGKEIDNNSTEDNDAGQT